MPNARPSRALGVDVAVVVAYGLMLPKAILEAPRFGCFNLHASALPRWRGAAPIQRAIMAGDTDTAVMVMRMEEGLDTGPVCAAETVPIGPGMTAGELHDQLAAAGARVDWVPFPGGHEIPPPVLTGATRVLTAAATRADQP